MQKIRSLRSAAMLTIATLLTTCLIGGTFAKYVTAAAGTATARVACWGFSAPATMTLSGMFSSTYTHVSSDEAVIAPGTSGNVTFSFPYDETGSDAPEVAYEFEVSVDADIDDSITSNPNIQFALDNGSWTTWDNLVSAILALSGDASGKKTYEAGTLPEKFTKKDDVHKIYWQWVYEAAQEASAATVDGRDTGMGNGTTSGDISFTITITASQVD